MRGAGRWRLYGPLTCMGALRSDERASANRTEALYGVGAYVGRARPHPLSTLGISQQARSTIYLLAGRAHASSDIAASGRPAAMGQLFPACTGMSGYSRRGRGASGPPLVISKYSPASARTSSSAPLCPSAPPALELISTSLTRKSHLYMLSITSGFCTDVTVDVDVH